MIKQIFFSIALILQGTALLSTEFPVAELDKFIQKVLTEDHVPGAAIALIQGDQVILLKGYGKRQFDKADPVDPDTLFSLASVSKTFTSAAVARLVDKKILDWDKEVIHNFPSFVLSDIYATRYSTSKDLLAHRTGLPAFTGDLLAKMGYSDAEVVRRAQYIPLNGSFREYAQYSNIGFFLAGELCAQASKKSFEEFVVDELLLPLEMKRTGYKYSADDKNSAAAHAFSNGSIRLIPAGLPHRFAADGGVISCARDMAAWVQMFINKGVFKGKNVLTKEAVELLFYPAMIAKASFSEAAPIQESPYFAYSLGWDNYQYLAQRVVEKGGALDGVRTVITLLPDMNLGIAILCNLNLTLFPERVRTEFLELAVGRFHEDLQAKITEQSKFVSTIVEPPKPPEKVLPSAHPLKAHTGTFDSEIYGKIVIEQEGDRLKLLAGPARYPGTLTHFSNDTYLLNWPLVDQGFQEITFTFNSNGEAAVITTETLGTFKKETQ